MAEQEEGAEPEAKKNPIVLMAIGFVLALGAGVGGTWFFMQGAEPETAEVEVESDVKAKAIYHSLRPAFVVNYMSENKSRYLQAEITLMSRDTSVMDAIVEHGPLVRSEILRYLADQQFSELRTADGKVKTRDGIKDVLNSTLKEQASVAGVESVLLTNFVMQ